MLPLPWHDKLWVSEEAALIVGTSHASGAHGVDCLEGGKGARGKAIGSPQESDRAQGRESWRPSKGGVVDGGSTLGNREKSSSGPLGEESGVSRFALHCGTQNRFNRSLKLVTDHQAFDL